MTVKVMKQLPSSERPPIRGNNEDGKGRGKYRENREREQEDGGEVVNNRIYVGGLGYAIEERDLYHFFNNFGPVQHVGIITKGGYTKCYGFVTFYCSEVVTRLLASPEKENLILKGRKLNIGPARQHSQTYWGRRQGPGVQAPLNHHRGQVQEEESPEKVNEGTELPPSVGSQYQPSYPAASNDASTTVPSTATAMPPYYQETGPYPAYYPQQQTVPVAYPYYYPYTQHIDPTLQEYYYPTYSYYHDSSYSYQDQAVPSGHVAPLPYPVQHQASLYTAMNYQGQPTIMQTPYFVNPNTEEMTPALASHDNSQGFYEAPPVSYYLPPGNGGDAHAYPDVIQAVAAQPDPGQAVHNPEASVLGDSGFQDAVENSFQGRGGQQLDPQQQGGPVMDGQYRSNPNGGKVFKEPVKVAKATGQGQNQGKASFNNFNSDSNARSFNKPRSFGENRPSPDQNHGPHNRDGGRGSRSNPLSYRTFSPFQGNNPRQFPFPPRNPRPQYQQQRGGRGRVWGYGHSGSGQGGNVRWSIGKKKPGKKGTGNDEMKGPKVEEKSSGCLASNQPDILQGPLEKLEIK